VKKLLSTVAAVAILGAALLPKLALADMSASFDRSANVNGLQQKLSSSVSINSFQPNVIGFNIYTQQSNPQRSLLFGAVPSMPFPSQRAKDDYLRVLVALDFGHPQDLCHGGLLHLSGEVRSAYRVIFYSECYTLHEGGAQQPAGALDGDDVNSASSAVGFWDAWAIFHGVFTPKELADQLDVLTPSTMFNVGNINASNRVVWQVQAYLQAYAYGHGGFTTGNMLPLVPLCVAGQSNSCGITPMDFDPQYSQRMLLHEVRAFAEKRSASAQQRIDREVHEIRQQLVASGIKGPFTVNSPTAPTQALSGTWTPDPHLQRQQALEAQRTAQVQQTTTRDAVCRHRLGLPANANTWTQAQIIAHAQCVVGG
jgi:hypothetical protein